MGADPSASLLRLSEGGCAAAGSEQHIRRRSSARPRHAPGPVTGSAAHRVDDGPHWLLIRRRIADGEYAFYRAHAPGPVPLAQLVKVAGSRRKIEGGFAGGKELAALDEHQVRRWASRHRWTILALLAHAFLAVLAATQADQGNPDDDQLIPLTCNEIRRLSTGLCQQPTAPRIQLHWSRWRRRHQYTARACHYRQRAGSGPYNGLWGNLWGAVAGCDRCRAAGAQTWTPSPGRRPAPTLAMLVGGD